MPLFKRKKTHTKYDKRVLMPKGSSIKPRRNSRSRRKQVSKSNSPNRRRSVRKKKFSKFISILILLLLFVILGYISIRFFRSLRNHNPNEVNSTGYVVGLEEIPAYPGSQFIFENNLEKTSVANFLGEGNSAYRLPRTADIEDVYQYYSEILPNIGWSHVLSVEIASEEMESGEYWVKEGSGLRIYSKFSDVWYESITSEDAVTGLRARVEKRIERDLMLADNDFEELLPDYPWMLKVPKQYLISYSVSEYEALRNVKMQRIGTENFLRIVPLGSTSQNYDTHLQKYTEYLTTTTDETWTISNTIIISTSNGSGLRGTIVTNSENRSVVLISNIHNDTVYLIESTLEGDDFFDYVIDNIEPQSLTVVE